MADTTSTSSAPFNPTISIPNLKNNDIQLEKMKDKSSQELAKLQGQLAQQLAQQQAQYQQQLQASQNAYNQPFQQAALTGQYNGQDTLAARQQATQSGQFDRSLALQASQGNDQTALGQAQLAVTAANNVNQTQLGQATLAAQTAIQNRQAALAELAQQQQNAIQQGNLDLARSIQQQQVDLQKQQEDDQHKLAQMQTSGYMDNGQLTEAARAARAQEANQQTATMGVDASGNQTLASRAQQQNNAIAAGQLTGQYIDPTTGQPMTTEQANEFQKTYQLQQQAQSGQMGNGQLTDASQQWRTSAALQYAQTAAQLQANPGDYFQAAAYERGAQGSGAPAFLASMQNPNDPSNMGFRTQGGQTPGGGSMAQIAGGTPAAYSSLAPPLQGMQQNQVAPATQGAQQAPGTEGAPSASIGNAQSAYQGNPATYTTQSNTALPQQQQQQTPAAYGDLASQRLAAFQPMLQQGAQKWAPGAMQAMSPTEQGLFSSAAKASGLNPDDIKQQVQRTAIHNDANAAAA